jgi:protein-disulfide isomerase
LDATRRRRSAVAPLFGALLLALACGTAEGTAQDDLRAARTTGSASAPDTIYEMSDFQCPYCAQFVRQTLPALEREYVATGKVKLVFVNFPLPMHPNAEPAAELAMCAARQGRFWQTHDLLFRHQEEWENLREPATYFLALGDSAGADREALVQCLRSGSTRELVRSDAEGSTRSGATGTPSFYVEGGLMRGVIPMPLFRQVLDSIIRVKTTGGR